MNSRNIVGGQRVSPVKKELARELRQDMTPEEKILWHYLRGRNLAGFKFRRQQVIDGGIHEKQKNYDVARDRIIGSRGLAILRITNESIQNELYDKLAYIRKTCQELAGK